MDPFWEWILKAVVVAGIAGVGWIAKTIIKPWSDAALVRANAFNTLVGVLQESVPRIQASQEAQTRAIGMNTLATEAQTVILKKKLGSDPDEKVCKYNQDSAALAKAKAAGDIGDLTDSEKTVILDRRDQQRQRLAAEGP